MPRSRGGAAPARSAPNRPQAAPPARAAPNQQQQRPMSTAPAQAQQAPPQAQAKSPGLFGQMASTAAGVAVGSSIGHAIGGFFGGGSSQAAQEPAQYAAPAAQDNYDQAGAYNTNTATNTQEASGPCAVDIKNFTSCMNQNNGDLSICGWYMEQLKACQQAAKNY